MNDRELVAALAALDEAADGEAFARRALALCVAATGAQLGWLVLGEDPLDPSWSATTGPEADPRRPGSLGVVEEALRTGHVVVTTDASTDERFMARDSVRRSALQVVLCAPIGRPAVGVLYLQGGPPPGPEGTTLVGLAARLLAPFARELLQRRRWEADATAAARRRLAAPGLVGRSRAMARMLEHMAVVAPSSVPVLFQGPTGVGKSAAASALHEAGPSAAGPFVTVDCTLLSPERAAAELFGARRGSWTGLNEDRGGWWEAADGGTLFLDEIGELPLVVQAQLLSVLETGSWTRVGETRRRSGRVRLMCATHRDLDARVREGAFRSDLLYRLAGFRVHVPALAERREDIGLLAAAAMDGHAAGWGLRVLPLSPAALAWLEARDWPGNVRELAHAVRSALLWASSEGADAIGVRHFQAAEQAPGPPEPGPDDLHEAVREFRRGLVRRVLEEEGGHVGRAAERLRIHRSHVHHVLRGTSDFSDTRRRRSS